MKNLKNVQGYTSFSMPNVSSEVRPETTSHFNSRLLQKSLYRLLVLVQMYITLVTFYEIFDAMFCRNCVI